MRSKLPLLTFALVALLVGGGILVALLAPRERTAAVPDSAFAPEASTPLEAPETGSLDIDSTRCLADSMPERFEPQGDWASVRAECARDPAACRNRCDADERGACLALGAIALDASNDAESQRDFEKACRLGDGVACTNYGAGLRDLAESPTDPLATCATRIFQSTCARGEGVWGCGMYGRALALGEGVEADPASAQRILEGTCATGVGFACSTLGQGFLRGWFGGSDPIRARAAFSRACTAGYASACPHATE